MKHQNSEIVQKSTSIFQLSLFCYHKLFVVLSCFIMHGVWYFPLYPCLKLNILVWYKFLASIPIDLKILNVARFPILKCATASNTPVSKGFYLLGINTSYLNPMCNGYDNH